LAAAGVTADVLSTKAFLDHFEQALKRVKALPDYERLPQSTREALLPPVEAFEGNPYQDASIREVQHPAGALKSIAGDTAGIAGEALPPSLAAEALSRLERKFREGKSEGKFVLSRGTSRRMFLGITGAYGALSAAAAVHNTISSSGRASPHVYANEVSVELARLHKVMALRRNSSPFR